MITVNMGSRYVISDLNKFQTVILKSDILKALILFCMFFVGTREILTSLFLTLIFIVIIKILVNENNPYNILPQSVREQMTQDKNHITEEEYKDALVVIDKYKYQMASRWNLR